MQELNSSLEWMLWPEAEDRAMRGRNPSAVFRTLYRQVGQPLKRLPSCAHTWRVENECDKSTPRKSKPFPYPQRTFRKTFSPTCSPPTNKQHNHLSVFP